MKTKVAGINSIFEALKGQRKVHKIYIQEGRKGKKMSDLLNLAGTMGVYVQYVEKRELDKMYTVTNHQGVVAVVDEYEYASMEEVLEKAVSRGEQPFLLILDGLEDPRNLGAIIRTAECAGVHGIIIPRHNSVEVTEAVARASAGAVEHVLLVRETNIVNAMQYLKNKGLWVIGADPGGGGEYFSTALPTPAAVVIGGEGKGIRRLVKENCDVLVNIPMFGRVNSLNASVAAALVLYEVLRQRLKGSV